MRNHCYSLPFKPIKLLDSKNKRKRLKVSNVYQSIDEHLKLLFLTTYGELRYDHDYGSVVNNLDFSNEHQSGLFEKVVQKSLLESIKKFEPRLKHIELDVKFDRKGELIDDVTKNYRLYIIVKVYAIIINTDEPFKTILKVFFSPVTE